MPDEQSPDPEETDRERADALRRTIRRKSLRRERARRRRRSSVFSYLGFFGLVGWTVAVPTVGGLALGRFIDSAVDSERNFTIAFLLLGVTVGITTAWYWIQQESRHDGR